MGSTIEVYDEAILFWRKKGLDDVREGIALQPERGYDSERRSDFVLQPPEPEPPAAWPRHVVDQVAGLGVHRDVEQWYLRYDPPRRVFSRLAFS